MYHRFEENKYPSTNIRISQFKQHIAELKKNNYNVISINEIINAQELCDIHELEKLRTSLDQQVFSFQPLIVNS